MSADDVPDGQLAVVVTFLEMTKRPVSAVPASALRLQIWSPDRDGYRALFRAVGSRWLWFSRLVMEDPKLEAILEDPAVVIFRVVRADGSCAGLLELDFRAAGNCQISFLGLVPELAGLGHGRWLLARALEEAWRPDVTRVHLHTCTLDHPAALPSYRRAGFVAYRRAVERFPDPRLLGILPRDCAPQVPLVGTVRVAAPSPASCV